MKNIKTIVWTQKKKFNVASSQVLIGVTSDSVHLDCSVPQGSKLGPRLYSDYTLPLGLLLRILLILYHFYADDSQLLRISAISDHDQWAAINHLERSVHVVAEWMFKSKLKLNPSKTEFLVISSSKNQKKIVSGSLKLEDSIIPRSDTVRNLGVTMDSNLDMHAQVSNLRKTCYHYISWVKEIRPYLNESDAKALIHSLVISRLDYCNALYYGLPEYLLHDLQMIMNDAARVVKNIGRNPNISITSILKDLHWLPVSERSKFKILTLIYKSLDGSAPEYISELLTMRPAPMRLLRSFDNLQLVVPKYKNKYGERSFSVSGPKLWNSVPFGIRSQPTLYSFKRSLKTYLFSHFYKC